MNDLTFRAVDKFPEPAYSTLLRKAFADYEPSELLTEVSNEEAAARSATRGAALNAADDGALRIGAFRGDALVGWTFAHAEGASHFHMVNSGVAPGERRHGVYSTLARMVIEQARSRGCVAILSRHATNNNAVIVAKLKLGFFVSGFEYSEVYGPLVRLTFLLGDRRRTLHRIRSSPIRRADPSGA